MTRFPRLTIKRFSGPAVALLLFASALAVVPVAFGQLPAAVGETPVPSLAPMLKNVTPAVVNIATRGTVQQENPLLNDPFFRRFFDIPNVPRERSFQSAGSGVIVDAKNGYIITNRSEEHTSELQSLMRISYAVFCLKKK